MRYHSAGQVPAKRHARTRRAGPDSPLLVEEVLGYEGFNGNESILYHLNSPARIAAVGEFSPLERHDWVPPAHVHRLTDTAVLPAGGDPVTGRRVLLHNDDVEISLVKPTAGTERAGTERAGRFHRNGEGDELVYVHRGGGVLRTVFGPVPFGERDYLVIPRGTTHRFELAPGVAQEWLCFHTPGELATPARYRNRFGQLLEHAPYSMRDFHPPGEPETHDESGAFELVVRVRGGYQRYELDRHPFDVVGWDGYVWPYRFSADDFEPRVGRFHLPPPVHQTFDGAGFVICTFAPRLLDWDPEAVALPYHHSNVQSEEVMFYAAGDYAARRGVRAGCLTLHPSGLPHGPQPGAVEALLAAEPRPTRTDELAVMCDTFRPLRLTTAWQAGDRPEYALSWNPDLA